MATKYFEHMFQSSRIGDSAHLLLRVESRITSLTNYTLKAHYLEKEVFIALKDMGPTKTPGEDGFPTLFFQKY